MEPVITPIMLQVWEQRINDPMVIGDVTEVFNSMAEIPETHVSLHNSLLPGK